MGFSKEIALGSAGKLVLSEDAGTAKVVISLVESVGGGSVAGAVKASLNAEVDLEALVLIDAALVLAEKKFPSAAPFIEGLKKIIDAEIPKVI